MCFAFICPLYSFLHVHSSLVARSLSHTTTHSHSFTHSFSTQHSAAIYISLHRQYILLIRTVTGTTAVQSTSTTTTTLPHPLPPSCHSPPPPPAQVIRGRSSPNSVECAHKRRAVTSVRAAACPTAPSRAAAHTRTHVANNLPPHASANYWMTLVRVLTLVLILEAVIK